MPPSANYPPQRRPLPSYAQGQPLSAVAAMLLVSAWEPGDEDEEVLRRLGSDREAVENFCRAGLAAGVIHHEKLDWIPVNRSGQSWRWLNIQDTWKQIAPWIDEATWQRFESTCLAVLSDGELGSSLLRNGLALTLALYGNSNGRVQLEPRPSIRASRIVEQLLTPPTRERWQALSEELGLLAEAAPEVFLTSLEQSLTLDSAGVAGLWKEAPTVMQTLDRALALLALDVELLPRVMLILARLTLTAGPAKDNWRDAHPLHVLEEIFAPQWPKTNAGIDERLAALEQLRDKEPEVAWLLFLKLLPAGGARVLDMPRPLVLRLSVPALRRGVSGAAIYGQLEALLQGCVKLAGTDAKKWEELVRPRKRIPDDLYLATLRSLQALIAGGLVRDDEQLLWSAFRSQQHLNVLLAESARPEAADRKHGATQVEALQDQLYKQLTPTDFVAAHAWLFDAAVTLSRDARTPEAQWQLTEQRRRDCVAELLSKSNRWVLLTQLAGRVKAVGYLARALADSAWAVELDQQFTAMQAMPQQLAVWFLSMRIESRPFSEQADWLQRLLTAGNTDDGVLLARRMTGRSAEQDAQLWDLLDAAGDLVRRKYWNKIPTGQLSPASCVERIVKNLLWAERADDAAFVVYKKPASTALLLEVLAAVRTAPAKDANARYASIHFCEELLESLQPVTQSQTEQVVQEELRWLPRLRFSDYHPRWVPAWVCEKPAAFVKLMQSGQANSLLRMWSGWPGDSLPLEQGYQRLYEWALEAIRLLTEPKSPDEPDVALGSVAVVLGRPKGPDGLWPSMAVRRLLEDEAARGETALFTAMMSQRRDEEQHGATTIERHIERNQALAADCEKSAQQLEHDWPASARLCRTLTKSYQETVTGWRTTSERLDEERSMNKEAVALDPLFPLTELQIENFRGLKEAAIPELHPRMNIFFGRNGSGKTTVMDALAIGLSGLAKKLPQEVTEKGGELPTFAAKDGHRPRGSSVPARKIRVRLVGQPQASEPLFWDTAHDYTRGGEEQDSESAVLSRYIPQLNEAIRVRDASVVLPVFAHYSVGRALGKRTTDPATPSERDRTRTDGLAGALAPLPSFEETADWFRREWFRQAGERAETPGYENPALREVLSALQLAVVTPEGMGLKNLRIDKKSLRLVVDEVRPDQLDLTLEIGQLSDGFRTVLALTLDLARRMVECNPLPEGEQERDGFGRQSRAVVLIDEVDEHLHPSWQKTVLHGLRRAFPQAQFFVSTHSPLVLSSEKDAKVWLMEDGKVSEVGQLYGNTSDTILRDYQDTLPRQDDIQELIKQARELVRLRKPDEAAVLIAKLEDLTEQPDLPELVGLRTGLTLLRHGSARPSVAGEKAPV